MADAIACSNSMRAPLLHESRAVHLFILLGLLLCIILTYYPVVTATYGFTDDYYDLQEAVMGGRNLWRHHVSEGRPLMGLMQVTLFPLAGTVAHLAWLRAINLAGLCVFASLLYLALGRLGFSNALAAAFSLGVAALPCFQICTAWAAMIAIPFACAIAGSAAWLALTLGGNLKPTSRLLRGSLAGAGLLVSLMIYQPAGMFFWVVVAMSLLTSRQPTNATVRKFLTCLAIGAGSIIAEFIVFKIGTACYGASDKQRAGLTPDVLGKAIWFLKKPLRNALNLDALHPSLDFAIIAAILIVAGLLLYFAGSWKQRGAMLGVALILIPLSYLPNLAAADSYGPHRTQVALTPLLAFYFVLALSGYLNLLQSFSRQSREQLLLCMIGGWAVVSMFFAGHNVVKYMTVPQAIEYRLVKSQLQKIEPADATTIYFIPATLSDRLTDFFYYDEFGTPSSFKVWAQEGMVKCGLREIGRDAIGVKIVAMTPEQLAQLPARTAVVDMRLLKQFR
jgi:hypothetical protein